MAGGLRYHNSGNNRDQRPVTPLRSVSRRRYVEEQEHTAQHAAAQDAVESYSGATLGIELTMQPQHIEQKAGIREES